MWFSTRIPGIRRYVRDHRRARTGPPLKLVNHDVPPDVKYGIIQLVTAAERLANFLQRKFVVIDGGDDVCEKRLYATEVLELAKSGARFGGGLKVAISLVSRDLWNRADERAGERTHE